MKACTAKPLTEQDVEAMWALFGPPPVLSSENKQAYYALRNGYVAYYGPGNIQHLSWIRELLDTQWEIFRHLRYRTAAIEGHHQYRMYEWRKKIEQIVEKRKHELRELLPHNHPAHERISSLQTGIQMCEAQIAEIAQRKPGDADHNRALKEVAKDVERLDKWLKNGVARRNNLLKILEYFCRPADQATAIPAAHYCEIKQDEVRTIAAPSLVPLESATGDVTTQDHTEAVEPAAE